MQWWFAFKFNSANFPSSKTGPCPFGGSAQPYPSGFSLNYAYASSEHPSLQQGGDMIGTSAADPLGATFNEVWTGGYYYAIWNDQFYGAPKVDGCAQSCGAPWGHSKGLLAWDRNGNGFILQVTTPSWPAAGSASRPRQGDGNTLGCVTDDDVEVSQDFFALALSHDDVAAVLKALANASVVTDPKNPQIVNNGGPADIQALVTALGPRSANNAPLVEHLSTGVTLISKPSALHVPPWQMVSSLLGGVSLRAATWWTTPAIPSTPAGADVGCWDESLPTKPGAVVNADAGVWNGKPIGLKGGLGKNFNHAKVGVTTDGDRQLAIFGDMNQQGALSGNCNSSQNGRGGLFFVLENKDLSASVASLIGASRG